MKIRSEPGYPDQLARLEAYQQAHPGTEISYIGPHWEAFIREDAGQVTFTRYELRTLLDKLESL